MGAEIYRKDIALSDDHKMTVTARVHSCVCVCVCVCV